MHGAMYVLELFRSGFKAEQGLFIKKVAIFFAQVQNICLCRGPEVKNII